MMRFLLGLGLLVSVLSVGCEKPSEESCRKAISNMQILLGTEHLAHDSDIEGEVRRCKGGSKKKAVECAIAAKSVDDLRGCDFMRIPATAGATAGSAAGSGSAAKGPAAGSAAGSAADPATSSGSAAGPAMSSGSAAGSATGSGSAAGSGAATGSAATMGSGAATGSGSATAGSGSDAAGMK